MPTGRYSFPLSICLAAAFLVGCPARDAAPAGATSGGRTVATVDGEPITSDELVDILTEEQYDIVRGAAQAIATNRLIDRAAAARGLTADQLYDAEVASRLTPPTDVDVRAFYESRREAPPISGRPLEEVRAQIAQYLAQQRQLARHTEFLDSLRAAADVRILIEPPRFDVPIPPGAPIKGPETAPVTLIEFADFECSACRAGHPVIERLLAEYEGRIRFVFRDFPLPNHTRAVPASEAAQCAAAQNRFWDYYRNLMTVDGTLDDADLKARASSLGLDAERFATCYDSRRFATAVQAAFQAGRALGVSSTPTFYLNGRPIVGVPPYEQLKELVEEELRLKG